MKLAIPRTIAPLVVVAGTMLIISVLGGIATSDLLSFQRGIPPADVAWTKSKDGFALGVRIPQQPIVLVDGRLDEKGVIEVWLTNSTRRILRWSNSRIAWAMNFTNETFKPNMLEARMHIPYPKFGEPVDLSPSQAV